MIKIGLVLLTTILMTTTLGFGESINKAEAYTLHPEILKKAKNYYGSRIHLIINKDGSISDHKFGINGNKIKFKLVDDKLAVDIDGDGVFDKTSASAKDSISISIPIKIGGESVDYPINVKLFGSRWVMLYVTLALTANVNGVQYVVIDNNMNGIFGEFGADHLRIGNNRQNPLMNIFADENRLYSMDMLKNSDKLNITPYSGPIASLEASAMDDWGISMTLQESNKKFTASVTGSKTNQLLPGSYFIKQIFIGMPKASIYSKNSRPSTYIYGSGSREVPNLIVKAGENKFKFGAPFSLQTEVIGLNENKIKIKKCNLIGVNAGVYRAEIREKGVKSKLECWVKDGNKEQMLSSMEYG